MVFLVPHVPYIPCVSIRKNNMVFYGIFLREIKFPVKNYNVRSVLISVNETGIPLVPSWYSVANCICICNRLYTHIHIKFADSSIEETQK